jgi:hypothetical protein
MAWTKRLYCFYVCPSPSLSVCISLPCVLLLSRCLARCVFINIFVSACLYLPSYPSISIVTVLYHLPHFGPDRGLCLSRVFQRRRLHVTWALLLSFARSIFFHIHPSLSLSSSVSARSNLRSRRCYSSPSSRTCWRSQSRPPSLLAQASNSLDPPSCNSITASGTWWALSVSISTHRHLLSDLEEAHRGVLASPGSLALKCSPFRTECYGIPSSRTW